jgi:hypothetical protein
VADAVIMQVEWSGRALLRSARAVCPSKDEDRGRVRAGKRTERVVQGEAGAGGRRAELVDKANEDCAWSST